MVSNMWWGSRGGGTYTLDDAVSHAGDVSL